MKFNLNLNNINYIKLIYHSENNTACCTKAAIKFMGEREITACARFEGGLRIETPQEVTLSFICDNGLYRTNTTLKYITNEEPYTFFILKTPQGLEYQQNREYFRVNINEDALLSFNSKVIACKTNDISANGVRLILPEKFDIPQNVIIDLLIRPNGVKAKAKFVRYDNEDDILKASFSFTGLPENAVDTISQLCIQKQLEYRRNSLK